MTMNRLLNRPMSTFLSMLGIYLTTFVLTTTFVLAQKPDEDRPTLRIKTLTKQELSGEYRTKDTILGFYVSFKLNKQTKHNEWVANFVVSKGTKKGKKILEVQYDPQAEKGLAKLNQGKVQFEQAVTQGRRTITPRVGKLDDALPAFKGPELKLLVALSYALGKGAGVNAKSRPISIPIHQWAMFIARIDPQAAEQDIQKYANKPPTVITPDGFGGSSELEPGHGGQGNATPRPDTSCTGCCLEYYYADDMSCKDMREETCATNCKGMCGSSCSCWDWVCGDCCCRYGCLEHDNSCRECRWDDLLWSFADCIACALFLPGNPGDIIFGYYSYCSNCSWNWKSDTGTGTQSNSSSPQQLVPYDCTTLQCNPKGQKMARQCCPCHGCVPLNHSCAQECAK